MDERLFIKKYADYHGFRSIRVSLFFFAFCLAIVYFCNYRIMKTKKVILLAAVAAVVGSAWLASGNLRRGDDLFRENLDVLTDGEVFPGPLCAYDPEYMCLYIYADETADLILDGVFA